METSLDMTPATWPDPRRCPSGGRRSRIHAWLAATALLAAAGAEAQTLSPSAQRGRNFAQHHCASCHAIGRIGASPLKEAPPFRTLRARYPIEDLAEAFAEGIVTGHPTMPEWRLDPGQIRDLLDYMEAIQD